MTSEGMGTPHTETNPDQQTHLEQLLRQTLADLEIQIKGCETQIEKLGLDFAEVRNTDRQQEIIAEIREKKQRLAELMSDEHPLRIRAKEFEQMLAEYSERTS